jgi:hypothetical protein
MSALQAFYAGAFSASSTTNSLADFNFNLPSNDTLTKTVPVALTSGYYLFTYTLNLTSTSSIINFAFVLGSSTEEYYSLPIVSSSIPSTVFPISFICYIPETIPSFQLKYQGATTDSTPITLSVSQFYYKKL